MAIIVFILLVVTSVALCLELPRTLWPRAVSDTSRQGGPPRTPKVPLTIGLVAGAMSLIIVVLHGGAFGNGPVASVGFCMTFIGAAAYFCMPLLYFIEHGENLHWDDGSGAMHAPGRAGTRLAFGFGMGTAFLAVGVLLIWASES